MRLRCSHDGISVLIQWRDTSPLTPLPPPLHVRHRKKVAVCKPGRILTRHWIRQHLDPALPASGTGINSLVFKPACLWYFVWTAPKTEPRPLWAPSQPTSLWPTISTPTFNHTHSCSPDPRLSEFPLVFYSQDDPFWFLIIYLIGYISTCSKVVHIQKGVLWKSSLLTPDPHWPSLQTPNTYLLLSESDIAFHLIFKQMQANMNRFSYFSTPFFPRRVANFTFYVTQINLLKEHRGS